MQLCDPFSMPGLVSLNSGVGQTQRVQPEEEGDYPGYIGTIALGIRRYIQGYCPDFWEFVENGDSNRISLLFPLE